MKDGYKPQDSERVEMPTFRRIELRAMSIVITSVDIAVDQDTEPYESYYARAIELAKSSGTWQVSKLDADSVEVINEVAL